MGEGRTHRCIAVSALAPLLTLVALAAGACDAPVASGRSPDGTGDDDDGAAGPIVSPDAFGKEEMDVVTSIRIADERHAISPLLFGLNALSPEAKPLDLPSIGVTFIRRGGDRCNAYNWETNASSPSAEETLSNDLYLVRALSAADQSAPGALDLSLIRPNRAAGIGTMVPFVLNGWVAGQLNASIPFDEASGWDRAAYFRKVGLVKPSAFGPKPDVHDDTVYTDEHLDYLRRQFDGDIYAPGPGQVLVGIDNEPDLWGFNFPMLQEGSGPELTAKNGTKIGNLVTGTEFTDRFVQFATRVRELAPKAKIVGPSHYHFDGFTSWHGSMSEYSATGRWYMDDFLATVKAKSEAYGKRLLDTWDFHWYPQHKDRDTWVWALDDSVRPLDDAEIEHIVQGPRSYWDESYDEESWITTDHLKGPAHIVGRLLTHIGGAYPGTELGVSEYFPGGCAHVSSGVAVADTLGVFARAGVALAAMWPTCERLEYALGGIKLWRNADGKGTRFAGTAVKVEHPEKVETSVYAGSDKATVVTAVVVNKTARARRVGLRVFGAPQLQRVDVYRLDAAHPSPSLATNDKLTKTNAYAYAAPPLSAALLVFHASAAP